MSATAALDAAQHDAELAVRLFASHPLLFGGIVLRGDGPAREAMLDFLRSAIAAHGPVVRIPATVDADRLLGGLDLSATLASGKAVQRGGLIDAAAGGVVIVPMAERLSDSIAAPLSQALDSGICAAILLDDGRESDEAPPVVLAERSAFHCSVADLRDFAGTALPVSGIGLAKVQTLTDEQLSTIAAMSRALGVDSARALIFAVRAARAHAARHARIVANEDDIAASIRLVLAPRATRLPEAPPPPPEAEPEAADADDHDHDGDSRSINDDDLDDIMLEAAAAAIPPHILDSIARGAAGRGRGQNGRSGQKQKSTERGRPLGARPGVPGRGKRLALIDTLRAAAPWQRIRRATATSGDVRAVQIRKSDLRVRAFEQRRTSLTIFAVDASGSSALSRLAEAKGAVELMLAQAYVKRSQVALIAFRQTGAEVLLPPTRSLTRARRALAALPGGGGTPLAAGLIAAQRMADAAARAGQTPTIALLTDGKGNVLLDGAANRELAMVEALGAARQIGATGIDSIVIDISPRPRPEAAELAEALGGRYLPLPAAQSAAMVQAIESLTAG